MASVLVLFQLMLVLKTIVQNKLKSQPFLMDSLRDSNKKKWIKTHSVGHLLKIANSHLFLHTKSTWFCHYFLQIIILKISMMQSWFLCQLHSYDDKDTNSAIMSTHTLKTWHSAHCLFVGRMQPNNNKLIEIKYKKINSIYYMIAFG